MAGSARAALAGIHPASDVLDGITLTDNGTPTFSLSETDLPGAEDVLNLITSPFVLDVTGVLASDALALSGNTLVDAVSVSDSAANILSNFASLQSVTAAGKLGTVTVTSGTLVTTDTSDAAFALYEHFTGSNGVTLNLTAIYDGPNGATGLFGQFLANGEAALGITAPINLTFPGGNILDRDFLFQLQHADDNGYLASLVMSSHILTENLSTSDLLLMDNATIINAVFGTGFLSNFTASSLTAAQAVQYFNSTVSVAVENTSAIFSGSISIPVTDAGVITAIVDRASDIQANLDAFSAALNGRTMTLPIELTDTLPPTINVTGAQATQDAAVLNHISSTFLLSVGGSAEDLNGLSLSSLSGEKVEFALTSLDHDITVTGNVFDVDLAKLAVANDTVTVSAYSSGGQTGTEIDLTGTDGLAHKIIILDEDPNSFEVYTPVDSGTAAGAHGTQVTGGVTVAQALANSGPEAISDTVANVQAGCA
ncbi:MAG TPA: hypothetical protein VMF58_13820 [Rhizomicrobium sp.]|nr:hypothetical protein [Rhizomicrobium sp.]